MPTENRVRSIVNRNSDVLKVLSLHPVVGERCLKHIALTRSRNVIIGIAGAIRTRKEQSDLYNRGRAPDGSIVSMKDVVTHARPGWSFHEYGLAYDICLMRKGPNGFYEVIWDSLADLDRDGILDFMEIGRAGEECGLVWGGRWPKNKIDMPHFEFHPRLTIEECVSKFGVSRIIPDDYFVVYPTSGSVA